ncbi:MAG: hypothetical protein DDT31_01565 [Syntrophomonadaceae bacterium]|nr:hypothetical protein [Bacillota bacterium]
MHFVTIVGIGTNEVPKFDADKAEWMNPAKGKIKFDENVDVTEAGIYNNCGTGKKPKAVVMTMAEYEAVTSGKNWLMPEVARQKILLAIDALKDALTEGGRDDIK